MVFPYGVPQRVPDMRGPYALKKRFEDLADARIVRRAFRSILKGIGGLAQAAGNAPWHL